MHPLKAAMVAAALLGLTSCAGGGLYGHTVNYAPLGDESKAVSGARDYDPVMAQRQPEEWRKGSVTLFGVVTNRGGSGAAAHLALSVRRLEPRNLCDSAHDEDTCRVTVSDAEFGAVHALATLKTDDDVGEHSINVGSLVRIVGTLQDDADAADGAPVIKVTYLRHWPRYYFVTRAAAAQMRQ
jgi:hypothetical protein